MTPDEPILDEELIYRRIPVSQNWYAAIDPKPLPDAFRPRTDDTTGLSVVRGEPYNTAEQAARGPSKPGYYVAVFRVGELRANGVNVEARHIPGIAGHAELTNLTAANRDSDETQRIMDLLAETLCLRVEGPFRTQHT